MYVYSDGKFTLFGQDERHTAYEAHHRTDFEIASSMRLRVIAPRELGDGLQPGPSSFD
jgi:hypothetical protein